MTQPATPTTSGPPSPSDADLIEASRAGDTNAYATLYQRHASSAHAFARHLMRGHAEADDAVAEAFARVLDQIRGGGGPRDAFRPYLLMTVRNVAYDRFRAEQRQVSSGDLTEYDPGEPFEDPAVSGLERRIVARAYYSLPERWRAILWHTAVEGARPAEIAELLGVTANGAAALAYRAREGLRQAYLQMHLTGVVRQECRPVVARLGAYVRGGLTKREAAGVEAHLEGCADCKAMYAELTDVNSSLRSVLGPLVLGSAFLAGKGGLLGWFAGRVTWFRHAPKHQQAAVAAAGVVTAVAMAGLAFGLTASSGPAVHHPASASRSAPAPPPVTVPRATVPRTHRTAPHGPAPRQSAPHRAPAAVRRPSVTPLTAHPAPRRPTAHRSKPSPPAQLAASINPVGTLLRGGTGIVTFTVANTGHTVAKNVVASIALPSGVTEVAGGSLGMAVPSVQAPGGWSCRPTAAGVDCSHGPLAPGQTATSYLRVAVSPSASTTADLSIRANAGGRPVTAHAKVGVAASGLPARYAAQGRFSVVVEYGSFPRCHPASAITIGLHGTVQWAGLYWAWAGPSTAVPITLRGPGTRVAQLSSSDVGTQNAGRWQVHQAFEDVSGLVTSGGGWTATVRPAAKTRYLGWALVVVTSHRSGPAGQVMVLDGTHAIVPSGAAFSVPIAGLVPSDQAARVRVVTWQVPYGPATAMFTEPPASAHSVTFAPGSGSYVAGVLAVTVPPDTEEYSERQSGTRDFTTLEGLRPDSLPSMVAADLGNKNPGNTGSGNSRAEGKDGVAWIAARCSLTRAMSLPTARWPCTGRAAVSRSRGITAACCSFSRASRENVRISRCCVATGTKRRSKDAGRATTTHSRTCRVSNSGSRRCARGAGKASKARSTGT